MSLVARASSRLAVLMLALSALVVAQALNSSAAHAAPAPAYDSIPGTLPPSWPSLGYQATQTAEFGDLVELAGSERELDSVTVGMADWACESGAWNTTCSTTPGATWTHPITVNLYEEGVGGLPGALIATVTQTATIPFRPSSDPANCGVGATTWFDPGTGSCYNGFAFALTFDFSALAVTVPDRLIVTVAYNTETYGVSPIGVDGYYNSLNVGLQESTPPTVGTDVDTDSMYWNTSTAANYADGGAGGSGFLRDDDGGWDTYALAIELNTFALPAPPPAAGGGSGGPALAETGLEPNIPALIGGFVAVLIGGVLLVMAPRRRGSHRA
jgi:hypothetical protein